MLVAECTPFTKKIRRAEDRNHGKILCTVNGFTSDEMRVYDAARGSNYHSDERYRTVIDHFSQINEAINGNLVEDTERLLKGEQA